MSKNLHLIKDLKQFLDNSPTAWHATAEISRQLREKGFHELKEADNWKIEPGEAYFVQRNRSALCAFVVPLSTPSRVRLLASHTDSPSLKLKPNPEIRKHESILLSVELYGAPLLNSWLNRDLGLAGRIIYLDRQGKLQEELVKLEQYPLIIPQLAIHLDREVNEKGLLLNRQEHLNALAALDESFPKEESYLEFLLKRAVDFEKLIDFELFLFPLEKARLIGYDHQLLASYRIDSLSSVHAILQALLTSSQPHETDIKMAMFWDNEEIGSHTPQGADSPFFNQIAERLSEACHLTREDYFRLIHQSACVSIDLAHALHPNHADKHDAQHQPFLGKGIVVKYNAQQRYATNARSSVPIHRMADLKQIPLQKIVSRNDMPCGSTIGPLQACQSGMLTVDIGCAQLSMHSAREIIACKDHLWLCQLLESLLSSVDWPHI